MRPNPMIQPTHTTSDQTYSQVTSTNHHTPERNSIPQVSPPSSPTQSMDSNESPPTYTPKPSNQRTIQPSNKSTPRQATGPLSILRKRLRWGDQEPTHGHGSRVRNVEVVKPAKRLERVESPKPSQTSPVEPKPERTQYMLD